MTEKEFRFYHFKLEDKFHIYFYLQLYIDLFGYNNNSQKLTIFTLPCLRSLSLALNISALSLLGSRSKQNYFPFIQSSIFLRKSGVLLEIVKFYCSAQSKEKQRPIMRSNYF